MNWILVAHTESFPRLWHLSRDEEVDDTRLLLLHLDGASNDEKLPIRREKDWSNLNIVEEMYQRPLDLDEEDEWRVSIGDERTRRELVTYLQRVELFAESLAQINRARKDALDLALKGVNVTLSTFLFFCV